MAQVKGKVYKTVLAMMYEAREMGSEDNAIEEIGWVEMRMSRWMCGVTKHIKIERIRGTAKVGEIAKK